MHSLTLFWLAVLDFLWFGSTLLIQEFQWFSPFAQKWNRKQPRTTQILELGEFDKTQGGGFFSKKDHVRECDWNLKSVSGICLWGMNHTPQLGLGITVIRHLKCCCLLNKMLKTLRCSPLTCDPFHLFGISFSRIYLSLHWIKHITRGSGSGSSWINSVSCSSGSSSSSVTSRFLWF